MADNPVNAGERIEDDDSDWEYGYHETETEVRLSVRLKKPT